MDPPDAGRSAALAPAWSDPGEGRHTDRAGAALTLVGRLPARVPTRAIGALGAQVMLALGGFVLQVVATRELGKTGLGTFALLYGAIVMATALSTGLLGDSLIVL